MFISGTTKFLKNRSDTFGLKPDTELSSRPSTYPLPTKIFRGRVWVVRPQGQRTWHHPIDTLYPSNESERHAGKEARLYLHVKQHS